MCLPKIEKKGPSTSAELIKQHQELDESFGEANVVAFQGELYERITRLTDGMNVDVDAEIDGPVAL